MERKWWLVIVGCITHAVNTGLSYFGMSAYFPSFEREFGWSRTAISGAFSLARIESGLLGPIEGYVTDRVGPQRMIFIGLFLCAGGFLALSLVDSLPMLYAVDRSRHRSRFQPWLQHADQRSNRQGFSREKKLGLRHLPHGARDFRARWFRWSDG